MKGENALGWIFLTLAIVLELSGTVSMKMSEGFTRLWPSIWMFVCYGASFTFLNFALTYIPIGVAYAMWSGVGIVLITLAGVYLFHERVQFSSMIWITVIIIGIVGLKLSGKSS